MTAATQQCAFQRWPVSGRPAIEVAHPPAMRHDHADLAEMARLMLSSRVNRFPALISASKLDQAEADAEIELFRQLADHWTWMVTGTGNPAPRQTIFDRCTALDRSIATIASIAAQRGGFDDDLAHQAHCVIALRWHADPRREHKQALTARINHQLRSPQKEKSDA